MVLRKLERNQAFADVLNQVSQSLATSGMTQTWKARIQEIMATDFKVESFEKQMRAKQQQPQELREHLIQIIMRDQQLMNAISECEDQLIEGVVHEMEAQIAAIVDEKTFS
jgi:hypothetical protein